MLYLSKKNISSKKLRFEELADRVIRACEEIGIQGVILKEWKPNPLENESTFGVARERKDDDTASSLRIRQDIGYLRRPDYSTLTFESFYINPRVFSRSAYDRFQAALEKQGLFPGCYAAHPLGPMFYTEREIKESLNPTPKYI
ncbi:hypothetical protein J4417_05365 [Candidatus Woesearchaeota archaeon]|nr:hypothetical protein [Candidatus Woesearchaeota archaeon]